MRNNFLLLLKICFLSLQAIAQPSTTYWQQQVNYSIAATLNDKENSLEGFETITYYNQSPDSLSFLWIHLWPNAYKNDKTAFSEQKISNGETDFYFSDNDAKGYINRLDFKVAGTSLLIEDHPQYIDVVKLVLPKPLAPNNSVVINTPFHVKIPYRFSRLGYADQHYSFTQWYPKVAVYDSIGWHAMPYLEWGEYYNDFGNYDVQITLPSNYVVAATGMLQNESEIEWMKAHDKAPAVTTAASPKKKELFPTHKKEKPGIESSKQTKTLHYTAQQVNDFAWFTDKRFIVKYDTVQLKNHAIDAWNFVLPDDEKKWNNSMRFTKNAVHFYSKQLGEYPYPQVSVVNDPEKLYEGMEYPMITILNIDKEPERELDIVIAHEIGHNWFEGILSTNERQHPWMDEGMNTFIEKKYRRYYYPLPLIGSNFIAKKLQVDPYIFPLDAVISNHTDQPVETASEDFTYNNYNAASYWKTALLMEKLVAEIGADTMQALMHDYYNQWKFKHPSPTDFKTLAEVKAKHSLDDHFALLNNTGQLIRPTKRATKFTGFFNLDNTHTNNYIGIAPAFGFNNYDKFSIGLLIHNYNIPANAFQFVATPMFATGSKQLVGYARAGYTFYPKGHLQKTEIYASAARFNIDKGTTLDDCKIFKGFSKITPGVYLELKKKKPTATLRKWMDIRSWIISEQQLEQEPKPAPADTLFYDLRAASKTTVIPQVTIGLTNDRGLYPWRAELAVQQVKDVFRTTLMANYFLNFNEHNEGIAVRFFFGKIFYTKAKTDLLRSENSRYHFTMYGPNGVQDYTYSNPLAERNQSTSLLGRQIMMRDGGFKYRSDYSVVQPGLKANGIDFFDNWLSSANFVIDLPRKLNPFSVLPFKVPLKIFADVGTSASPWTAGSELPKFLYSMGLELPLFKVITVYYPLIQSKAFEEPNSVNDPTRAGGPSWWQKRLTFSVDITTLKKQAEKLGIL